MNSEKHCLSAADACFARNGKMGSSVIGHILL